MAMHDEGGLLGGCRWIYIDLWSGRMEQQPSDLPGRVGLPWIGLQAESLRWYVQVRETDCETSRYYRYTARPQPGAIGAAGRQ